MTTAKSKAPDTDAADTEAPKKAEAKADDKPATKPERFHVVKALTVGSGQTYMPGDTLEIADGDPDWPERRPAQLVKQGYLRHLEG